MKLCVAVLSFAPVLFAQSKPTMTSFLAPEIAATGITLEPVTDANVELVKSLLGDDYATVQPILPYAAVITNGSQHRILQITTRFQWRRASSPYPHGAFFTTHSYFTNVDPPNQINPGESRLCVPNRYLDKYFAYPPALPKACAQTVGPSVAPSMVGPSLEAAVKSFSFPDEDTYFPNGQKDLSAVGDLKTSLDSVVLEGIGMPGPDETRLREKGYDRKTVYSIDDPPGFPRRHP